MDAPLHQFSNFSSLLTTFSGSSQPNLLGVKASQEDGRAFPSDVCRYETKNGVMQLDLPILLVRRVDGLVYLITKCILYQF